jgi:nucleoside-diphosphate-sugar epimerase
LARVLIVGCGCRGRELGARLAERGWEVRGTSRSPGTLAEIESAGIEPAEADPDRPGTILELCGDVAVVIWLLGSASGDAELVAAVNGPRLERLLEKLVDSPVRAFAYESVGLAPEGCLETGRSAVEAAARTWRIPVAYLDLERADDSWAEESAATVAGLLAG